MCTFCFLSRPKDSLRLICGTSNLNEKIYHGNYLGNYPHPLEKNVQCDTVGFGFLVLSTRSDWLIVLFQSSSSFLFPSNCWVVASQTCLTLKKPSSSPVLAVSMMQPFPVLLLACTAFYIKCTSCIQSHHGFCFAIEPWTKSNAGRFKIHFHFMQLWLGFDFSLPCSSV